MRNVWYFGILLAVAAPAAAQDMPLSQVLVPGEGWQAAAMECKYAAGLAGDGRGNVYVADPESSRIWRIDKDGKASVFGKRQAEVYALAWGAGHLYAGETDDQKIVVYDAEGKWFAEYKDVGSQNMAMAVTDVGECYITVGGEKAPVFLIDRDGKRRKVAVGFASPGALLYMGGTLVVGDAYDKYLHAFRVQKNGDLDARERYYPLRVSQQSSGNAGLTLDAAGRVYATSWEGVQVFDPTGRLSGVMLAPGPAPLGGVAFGGADLDRLYVVCGAKVYVRKVQSKGVKAQAAAP